MASFPGSSLQYPPTPTNTHPKAGANTPDGLHGNRTTCKRKRSSKGYGETPLPSSSDLDVSPAWMCKHLSFFVWVPSVASLCARRGAKNTRSAFCSGFGPRAGAFSRNSEVLNKKEGGVGQCSKALIGSTRGAPSTPQLRQERRSGTFPRTVIPQCLIFFCISADRL